MVIALRTRGISLSHRTGSAATVVALALAVVASTAGSAAAATTPELPCVSRDTARKFRPVDGDPRRYFTAPSATFESGTPGWQLAGASVVDGNESWSINGPGQVRSLQVTPGGSAASPNFCVQLDETRLRFFFRGEAGARVHLRVEVTNDRSDRLKTLDWEQPVAADGSWTPSRSVLAPRLRPGHRENLRLIVTAVGGAVQVDDIEIDPWRTM